MKSCIVCHKEMIVKRNTKKFCSSTCRSKYFFTKEEHSNLEEINILIEELNRKLNKYLTFAQLERKSDATRH